jgi:hypothetical protein
MRNRSGIAAVVPSVLVVCAHFGLSALLGPQANIVFQRWFDTGEVATGSGAVVSLLDRILSLPLPATLVAEHPSRGLSGIWWAFHAADSVVWGLCIFGSFVLTKWFLDRTFAARSVGEIDKLNPSI